MKNQHKNLSLAFSFKGSIIKRLFRSLLVVSIITCGLILIHNNFPQIHIDIGAQLPGYMGVALGLLLVFRNNTAYDKWWEARKELGALVNTARNIGITINGFIPHGNSEKTEIAELTKAFVYALKEHLREGVDMQEIKVLNLTKADYNKIDHAKHKPNVIANLIMMRVESLYLQKVITDIQQQTLVHQINNLIDILGKCERIKNTPIPMAYGFLLKFFIGLYVVVLPLGLIKEIGWWSVPLVIMLYYIMMSIVITAEEIEEPFGRDLNDLPLDAIAGNISRNIDEILEHH
jgi:putative membrane protein